MFKGTRAPRSFGKSEHLLSIVWLVGGRLFQIVCALAVGAWVARYLGPDRFGVLNYCLAFTSLFGALASMGMDQLIIKHLGSRTFEPAAVLGSSLYLRLFTAVAAAGTACAVSHYMQQDGPEITLMIGVIAAGFLFQSIDVVDLWFQSTLKSRKIVIPGQISLLASSFYEALLVFFKSSLSLFALSTPIKGAVKMFASLVYYRSDRSHPRHWKYDRSYLRALLAEGWPMVLTSLSIIIYSRIDQIMIEAMRGPVELGLYAAAARVLEQWCFVPIAIVQTLYPTIIQTKRRSEPDYQNLLHLTFCGLTLLSIVSSVLVCMFARPVVHLLYGADYAKSADVLALLIWSGLFVSLGLIRSRWLTIEGRGGFLMASSIAGAVCNVALNYWLIPAHGAFGAAIATLVSYGLAGVLTGVVVRGVRPIFWMQIRAIVTLGLPAVSGTREFGRLLAQDGERR